MIIRAAHEADAPAMGQVMVATYLAAHRDQMPDAAWTKRAEEWTPEVSADGWARRLRAIATDERPQDCIYVAHPPAAPEQRTGKPPCRRKGRASTGARRCLP